MNNKNDISGGDGSPYIHAPSNEQELDQDLVPITSTFCHNCIFADYIDHKQTGCKAGRLDHFRRANIPIRHLTNDNTDKEDVNRKESLLIEGKICVFYRNAKWAHEHYPNRSVTNIYDIVTDQLSIPYHALIFFRHGDTIDDLRLRLSELHNQKVKPKLVTVVDRSHTVKSKTATIMKMIDREYSFAYWKVQRIQAVDQLDTDVIDLSYDNTKRLAYMFYITFECKYTIPLEMSADIHKSLHDDMKSFSILLPNSQNSGGGALKLAHEKHAGNSFSIPLADKIRHYDDAPHLIKKVEEICPSLRVS